MSKQCDKGLDNRCRDNDGEIREKRGDTRIDTLRKTYGPNFGAGYRGDMRLDTLRERERVHSLTEYLKKQK